MSLLVLILSAISVVVLFTYVSGFSYIDPFTGTTLAQAYLALNYGHIEGRLITSEYVHTWTYTNSLLVVPGVAVAVFSAITYLKPYLVLYAPIPLLLMSLLLCLIQRVLLANFHGMFRVDSPVIRDLNFVSVLHLCILTSSVLFLFFTFAYMKYPAFEYNGIKYLYFVLVMCLCLKVLISRDKRVLMLIPIAYFSLVFTHYRFFLALPMTLLVLYVIAKIAKIGKEKDVLLIMFLMLFVIEVSVPFVSYILTKVSVIDIVNFFKNIFSLNLQERIEAVTTTKTISITQIVLYKIYKLLRGAYTLFVITVVLTITLTLLKSRVIKGRQRRLFILPLLMIVLPFSMLIVTFSAYAIASRTIVCPTLGPESMWLAAIGISVLVYYMFMKRSSKLSIIILITNLSLLMLTYLLYFVVTGIRLQDVFDILYTYPPFDAKVYSIVSFLLKFIEPKMKIEASIYTMFSLYMSALSQNCSTIFSGHLVFLYGRFNEFGHSIPFLLIRGQEIQVGLYDNLAKYIEKDSLLKAIRVFSLVYDSGNYILITCES